MSRFQRYAKGAERDFGASYDSDEDLPEDVKKKIKQREERLQYDEADELRKTAWETADTYPRLKKMVKGFWYGDKRKN